jgi:serine/threonine-protein kinase RsbW
MESQPHHVQVFPARMSALPAALEFAARVCGDAGIGRDVGLRLAVLIEELFTNTVVHGHGQDSEAPVRLALSAEGGRVALTYEDTGRPYDPFAEMTLPDEGAELDDRQVGGLGVVLISAMAEDVEYRREHGVNRVSLVLREQRAG